MRNVKQRRASQWVGVTVALAGLAGCTTDKAVKGPVAAVAPIDIAGMCRTDAVQAAVAILSTKVVVKEIPNGPKLPGGVNFVAATDRLPAYCQISGSYETNPQTGKTANFLATMPMNWNGKYLQLGCSGACGVLLMNNPVAPPITITAQGYPGQLVEKGYATFGNDLGHIAKGAALSMNWAVRGAGQIDEEGLTDFLYRADQVMARMGKAFTSAFYAKATGAPARITKSYFNGCSQGGREAMVAAARFPEEFDGIIAGSPAIDLAGIGFQVGGATVAALRSADANITQQLMDLVDRTVKRQCDPLDGVTDGLIQNPAACNFRAERDLPLCDGSNAGQCFTKAQRESVSAFLSAATDERGRLVQPGYTVSEPTSVFAPVRRPDDLANPVPWGAEDPTSGYWGLADGVISTLAHRNDPSFRLRAIFAYGAGGGSGLDGFHALVPEREVALSRAVLGSGSPTAADMAGLLRSRTKLILYHNLGDQVLTPYMSINFYKRLAALHGGYGKVQRTARLFTLPGTGHCGMSGVGPTNFDAIGALEGWVERGTAPNALLARQLDPKVSNVIAGKVDWSKPALRTMPLCAFPQMARYKGTGDVKDATNWSCKSGDTAMLKVGESGRQAGVID
ncbi:tannase/feruloyl esterase family alpha/beta hydrolase [Sphingobium sufflavum]|uniref:tannase/feruloyl esterase family alpha/beta hydrolase n=1 Tax=Sphingobium sufflavum TaxID=1129547 RepID=UPI001F39B780|nr:tannase/feruloyl esterase family alpha/beta hydrolase [Sphingobium sufflavum]MCE7797147.1 tannase/feruloyl esterase family alpha/beta hydrolase [Sphingobium sufflavum]